MRLSYRTWISLSGCVWLAVGVGLLTKGLRLVTLGEEGVVLKSLSLFLQSKEKALFFIISLALFLGFIKGRFILSKTVKRVVNRIYRLPFPVALKDVYPKSYYFLLGGMVLLGMTMKWIPLELEVRGFIDIVIGSALMNGSFLYFKAALFPVKSV